MQQNLIKTVFLPLIFFLVFLIFLITFYNPANQEAYQDITPAKEVVDSPIITEKADITPPKSVLIKNVPFTSQAPLGEWEDERQHYGCEEANLIMAMRWATNQSLTPQEARDEIITISDFELKNYHHFHDYSIADTYKVLKDYFNYDNAFVKNNIGIADIKTELANGNLVIIPINGRMVSNQYYTPPGPLQHQIIAIGYDDDLGELIVHDPGVGEGKELRYFYKEISAALMDYETGLNETSLGKRTAMLVVKPLN